MLNFSYLLSPTLKKELENTERVRNAGLITLLSPYDEIRLRFESLGEKISSNLFLSGRSITPHESLSIIENNKKYKGTEPVFDYYSAQSFIRRYFLLTNSEIKGKDIAQLLQQHSEARIKDKKELDLAIDFITVNPEHGIVQAGLAFFLVYTLLSDDNNRIRLSSNASEVFLAKYGYDMRGLLNLDEYWIADLSNLKDMIAKNINDKNLSTFLEYYVSAVSIQSEKALAKLRNRTFNKSLNTRIFDLTKRQKSILSLFEIPDAKVTNRDVQKEFKVSQITASRDLSKLATLGLIFPNGKGRSVYYTKI